MTIKTTNLSKQILFIMILVLLKYPTSAYSSNNTDTATGGSIYFNGVEDFIFINNFEVEPILKMTTNIKLINSDDSAIISWRIFNNATTCTKSGDWSGLLSGNDVSNGVHSQQIDNIVANSNYGLSCSNDAGASPVQTVSIIVHSINAICSEQPPILNGAEDFTILANGTSAADPYNGLFSDLQSDGLIHPWPGLFGDGIGLSLDKNQYISAAFLVNDSGIDAQIVSIFPSSTQGPTASATTITISECPGDFSTHLNQSQCKTNFEILRLSSKITPSGPAGFFCELQQGQIYYLNIVHSDNSENDNYETSDCDAAYCGVLAWIDPVIFGL